MEVLAVQNQYSSAHYALATDWKSQLTLSAPATRGSLKAQSEYIFNTRKIANATNNNKILTQHITNPQFQHKLKQQQQQQKFYEVPENQHKHLQQNKRNHNIFYFNKKPLAKQNYATKITATTTNTFNSSYKLNCDKIKTTAASKRTVPSTTTTTTTTTTTNVLKTAAVQELSQRLLEELRAAKSRHLACTEVHIPCDLTQSIAFKILQLAHEDANGLRACIIYIEFEDEPHNSRRIATLDLLNKQRSQIIYEIYVTLRQDYRGWTALLPQFIKHFSRTITISPHFNITKHKPYSTKKLR